MKIDPTAGGFRSPATENAFRRFERRVLDGLDGDARDRFESEIAALRERAEALAATDTAPYGRSLEHEIKRILNDPDLKKAIRGRGFEGSDDDLSPNLPLKPEPLGDEPSPLEPALPGIGTLDVWA